MAVAALRQPERAPLNIAVLCAAVLLGAVAAVMPPIALALALGVIGLTALYYMPWLFVPLMIASVYFGAISLGGFAAARIVGPIALPVAIVASVRNGGMDLRGSSLPYWIAAYTTFATASLLWTQDQPGTVGLLFSLGLAIVYTVAIAALTRTRRDLRMALRAFVVSSIALFSLGILALAAYGDPLQAQELIGDRNFFAAFLAVGLSVSVALAIWPVVAWERWLGVAGAVICTIGVVGSQSQGGMLSLLATLVVGSVLVPRPKLRRKLAPVLVLAAPVLIVVVVIVLGSGGYSSSGGSLTSSIETSSVDRLNLWRGAMNAWSQNPVTGIGFGAYAEHSAQWMLETPGVNLRLYNLPEHAQEAHNSYVEAISELGPLGLGLFLSMIIACTWTLSDMLRRARKLLDTELEAFAIAMLLAITGFAVASFFLSIATNRTWWVIFGLTIAAARLAYDERLRDQRRNISAATSTAANAAP